MKTKISSVIAIIAICLVLCGLLLLLMNLSYSKTERAEKTLNKYKADFEVVAQYMTESEYSYVCIIDHSGYMNVGREKAIDDEKLNIAISNLFKKAKITQITRINNTVTFETRGFNYTGIAYSVNKRDLPQINYVSKLSALSDNGWYYFEAE